MKVKYKVNKEHTSENTDPIVLNMGDVVKLGEKSEDNGPWPNWIYCSSVKTHKEGWTPIQVLEIQGDSAIAIADYNAKEMTVLKGDILKGSTVLNGWTWCTRESDGEQGWVPSHNLEEYSEIEIREARISDYSKVAEIVKEVYKLHLDNTEGIYLDIDNPLKEEQFQELLNLQDCKVFVAENIITKDILAYSIIQKIMPKGPLYIQKEFVFITDFGVKASNKRNGIGKLMFKHIVNYAETNNIKSIELNVWAFNKAAIKFYEEMGLSVRNMFMEIKI